MPTCTICEGRGKLPPPVPRGADVECLMCQGTGEMSQKWYDGLRTKKEESVIK